MFKKLFCKHEFELLEDGDVYYTITGHPLELKYSLPSYHQYVYICKKLTVRIIKII